MATFTPYTTGQALFGTKPSWLSNPLDIQRIQSYQLYEEMYWTAPDVFKVKFRGSNDLAIYVPSGRTIVDTVNRFTATGFKALCGALDPSTGAPSGVPTPESQAAQVAINNLLDREKFIGKFNGAKRYGMIRGDWIWHLTADLEKPEGSRISIVALDPAMYFPITDDDDVDRIVGVHLVDQVTTEDGPRIHRLTYRKVVTPTGVSITVEEGMFKTDKWEGPEDQPETVIQAVTTLPPEITAIPVYHIKNFEEPGNPFGSSELRGFESMMAAINQCISDEDLSLAMEGLGLYVTDAPQPTDPVTGKAVPWQLGPGRVVKIPEGSTFGRTEGVKSIAPYGDHFDRLTKSLFQSSATPDVAMGMIDNHSGVSGIALALQLSPLLAKSKEKDDEIIGVHNQMFFNILNGWFPAYEGVSFANVEIKCSIADPVPPDRAAMVAELDSMLAGGVIDTQFYRDEMTKLGYVFPDDIAKRVAAEKAATAATTAAADPFAVRSATELNGGATGDPATQ